MASRSVLTTVSLVGSALLAIGLFGCAPGEQPDEGESEIIIATGGIPGAWNAGSLLLGDTTIRPVYESLFEGEGGQIRPQLASEIELSDDGKVADFTLRDDVTFVDGIHMDAAGVVKYLNAANETEGAFFNPLMFGNNEFVLEVTGEYTFRMTFERVTHPAGDWLGFGEFPIASPATVDDPSLFDDGPVGTGPYLVDEVVPDVSISYVRNPEYWNPEAYDFDRITFVVYEDEVAILNALKSGQLDVGRLGVASIAEAESAGLSVFTGVGPTTWLEILDLEGSLVPALADVRVRQAMSMAIDRQAIGDAINFGYAYATSQLGPKGSPEYVEGGDDRYPYDPERAKELLAEAGYPDGFDLKFRVAQSWGAGYRPVLESAFAEIGIRVEYEVVPDEDTGKLILEDWPAGTQPIAMATSAALPDDIVIWIPSITEDFGPDPRFRELYDLAGSTGGDEHDAAMNDLGEYLLDTVRHIPIGTTPAFYVTQPDVSVEWYDGSRYVYLYQFQKAD